MVCNKVFRQQDSLKRHAEKEHPNEAELVCKDAALVTLTKEGSTVTYNQPDTSKFDKFSESRDGQVVCKLCNKGFARRFGFKKHFKIVHEKVRYQCKLCDTSFGQKIDLKRHARRKHPTQIDEVMRDPVSIAE